MAHIRTHNTTQRNRRSGKPVKRYEVVWREQATDANGLPTRAWRARQESYATRKQAEVRRDELNNAKHTATGTTALADAKKAGELPFGHYAQGWLARQRTKVADGRLKQRTCERYEGTVRYNLLPCFGSRPIGAITLLDCEQFRADLASRRSSRTVRNVWQVLRHVLRYAYEHNAITAVPTDAIDRTTARYAVGDGNGFEHKPLTGPQVAAVAAKVGERYPVYELLVLFMAYTGLRAAEVQGLEVRDLVLTTGARRHNQRQCAGAAHQDPPQAGMGHRHAEVKDKQAHRAVTGLARGTRGGLPRDYAPAREQPNLRALAAAAAR